MSTLKKVKKGWCIIFYDDEVVHHHHTTNKKQPFILKNLSFIFPDDADAGCQSESEDKMVTKQKMRSADEPIFFNSSSFLIHSDFFKISFPIFTFFPANILIKSLYMLYYPPPLPPPKFPPPRKYFIFPLHPF